MTKKELAGIYKSLCTDREITKTQAAKEIDDFLKIMEKALMIDGKIKFIHVGVLEIVNLKPRRIADPNTKKPMLIHPPKDVRFKTAPAKVKK